MITIGWSISAHQCLFTHTQSGVHDELMHFFGKLIVAGHLAPGHLKSDLAAQDLLVELECCLALTVESDIWIDLHRVVSFRLLKRLTYFPSYASFIFWMFNFFIGIMACMTRFDFSGSPVISSPML